MADPNEEIPTESGDAPPVEEPQNLENLQPLSDNPEPRQEQDNINNEEGNEEKRATEKENAEEQNNDRPMGENENLNEDQGKEYPDENDGEDSQNNNVLTYGCSIIRAIIFFMVGCTIVSDLTGIVLWHCLENRNH